MSVLCATPGDERAPLLLMFHDGPGIREATWDAVRRVASAGFRVFCPDRYYRFGRFVHFSPEELHAAGFGSELMKRFFGMVTATTDDLISADVAALLATLAPEERLACLGYCNGVRTVLRTMHQYGERCVAGVGFHPSFCVEDGPESPHLAVTGFRGRVYFAFGEDDDIASVEHNRPLIAAATEVGGRVSVLPKAEHGFAMHGPHYSQAAADVAYSDGLSVIREAFGNSL